jgi:protein-disulfide isomerase
MRGKRFIYVCSLAVAALLGCLFGRHAGGWTSAGANADGSEVVAVVNGRKITRREVDERAGSQAYALESKLYQLRKNTLNGLVGDELVAQEARRRGVSVEEIKKELVPAGVQVTDAQVDAVYASQAKQFGGADEAAAKQQIRAAVERRARFGNYDKFVAGLREAGGVTLLLRPPAPVKVDVRADGPSKGSPAAPVVLVEFSDFECPACKNNEAMVSRLLAEYGDKVRLVYKHLPLPMHKHAFGAAQAAVCAGEQGNFWGMHDLLFEQAGGLSADALRGYAARLGLEAAAFDKCLESEESRAAVTRDSEEAGAAGIRSTPSFVLNGKLVVNPGSLPAFKELIDLELQAANSGR